MPFLRPGFFVLPDSLQVAFQKISKGCGQRKSRYSSKNTDFSWVLVGLEIMGSHVDKMWVFLGAWGDTPNITKQCWKKELATIGGMDE